MPRNRRPRSRRRLTAGAVAGATFLLAVGGYVPLALFAEVDAAVAVASSSRTFDREAASLTMPSNGATAIGAVGFDGILAQSGSEAALPIASLTKVVTALVVLDAKPLGLSDPGPDITLSAADVALYTKYLAVNGKVEPVRAGVVVTQRDLLEIMLVSSANNYAESLAVWAFGSEQAFVAAAAEWLTTRGLSQTVIVEPTGLSASNVSTARELVDLGKIALADPVIEHIVSSTTVDVPFLGIVDNTNDLLGIDGIDGIKTGTLDAAGACLLFSVDYRVGDETVTVVGVVLGGEDHETLNPAVRELLGGVEDGFQSVTLATAGDSYASYDTPWEQTTRAIAAADASVVVWSNTAISSTATVGDVSDGAVGDVVGSVTFAVGGEDVVVVPLVLDAPLPGPEPLWRLTHPLELLPD